MCSTVRFLRFTKTLATTTRPAVRCTQRRKGAFYRPTPPTAEPVLLGIFHPFFYTVTSLGIPRDRSCKEHEFNEAPVAETGQETRSRIFHIRIGVDTKEAFEILIEYLLSKIIESGQVNRRSAEMYGDQVAGILTRSAHSTGGSRSPPFVHVHHLKLSGTCCLRGCHHARRSLRYQPTHQQPASTC